jgi:hypothetical protein
MRQLKKFFLITDVGFVIYWLITILNLIPEEYLFKDYKDPLLVAWNWSFFPLDMLISFTGFYSIYLYQKKQKNWVFMALISLVLTFCSGLQAIAFWIMRADFDLSWWIPNLFLMIYPIFFIIRIRPLAKVKIKSI